MNAIERALQLNAQPLGGCLDRKIAAAVLAARPLMFSNTRVFVAAQHLDVMARFCAAMERVVALPGWQSAVLAGVPDTALHAGRASGVFFGYDFHIGTEGPKLIEINTNAGGGLLNLYLLGAQQGGAASLFDPARLEARIVRMFRDEWQACRGEGLPALTAIVDDAPEDQYLNPDFVMCRQLLERHGMPAIVCDARELRVEHGELRHGDRRIDMVYNRLTDFLLGDPSHNALRDAWLADAAVVTPHPRAYALFADKRHLVLLSDDAWLASIGVDAGTRELIGAVVPRTVRVTAANADELHARRKHLFFKPAQGYGARAAYRGQNVTTRVFAEIVANDYVAQDIVPPSTRAVMVDGRVGELKYDLRCYAYRGDVLLTAARLWQGQTTNFRTPGGGFTPVVAVP